MQSLIPLNQWLVCSGRCCTERSDTTYQRSLITIIFHTFLQIGKCGIDGRISEGQKHDIFSLIQYFFQCFCSLSVIFLQFLCIVCHWHIDRKQFFVCQFRHRLYSDLVRNSFLCLCPRYCNHLVLADHTNCLQSH